MKPPGTVLAIKRTHVDCQFSLCFPDLGIDRLWLLHLRQKAILLAADGRGTVDDGRVLFRQLCLAHDDYLFGPNGSRLLFVETRLLTHFQIYFGVLRCKSLKAR